MKDDSHYLPAPFDLADVAGAYFNILQFDVSRYLIWAGAVFLLVNVLLAARLAGRKIRTKSPDAPQMRREIATSLRTAAIFALVGTSIFILRKLGVIEVYLDPADRGWGYFAFSVIALIVLHDAWFYWTHRLIHHPRLFRRVHRTHHKSHNPSPWTAYSFDISEAVVNAAYLPFALLLIPASPLAIFIFLSHMMFRNAIGHCGYELFPSWRSGRPMFGWLTSVTHHDLHHAQAGWNYGLYFTWWDRLMGTEHPLYAERFAEAVRKPLDGSAVQAVGGARKGSGAAALLALGLAAAAMSAPHAARADDKLVDLAPAMPVGVWATEGHGAHVRFEPCESDSDLLCGRLVWSWDPEINASGETLFLGDFRWDGEVWDDGWLANPEDGKTYRGEIRPVGDGVLDLKGCAFVFCRSQIWRRLDTVPGCVQELTAKVSPVREEPHLEG